MAIQQLTEEQVRDWSVEEKDRWWLENVFRGNMPQLTVRSAITGMLIGGILSLTNLYIGMRTGWTLGVGITSVILAFTAFKIMHSIGLAKEFTILENNCMQSIATAAGYMTSPLIASLAAYMMITNTVIPILSTIMWMISISVLGVLFAFPLKRRFINDEQHPFPEGRAAGVVMDALHTSDSGSGLFKGKILIFFGFLSAAIEFFKQKGILEDLHAKFLALPEALEEILFHWIHVVFNWKVEPSIWGTKTSELTVSFEPDHVMMAAGGLMGIRTGVSLLIGAVINYCIVAPWMIQYGDIYGVVGDAGELTYGFKQITTWALWGGVAMMTTASLFAFASKPKMILSAFRGVFGKSKRTEEDCLRHIELPMVVFVVGIPIVGSIVVVLAHVFFEVDIWLGILAVPLVFVFTIIAAHSTALTAITPTGALGKLTQLTYAGLSKSMTTNIMTASITAEVAGHASNLMMDIKPGYMLGGKPRHQAMGHVLGIFAGAFTSVPVFYYAFLKDNPNGLITDQYPQPAATIWKAVAEILTRGLSELPTTAVWAAILGALVGILFEAIKLVTKGRFPISAVGMGLAFVIPFTTCFAMFLGSFFFWLAGRLWKREGSFLKRLFVDNLEPVCAGVIAGGALLGIASAIYMVASS
ncbi:MAG: OPT/YSL family transporter [Pirellulales bacterium]|nr:OPT/YSL family transporter [Pirellulales bacterium]